MWFDIEDCVTLFVPAAEISRVLLLLDGLHANGIRPSGEDGSSVVTVCPTRLVGNEPQRVRDRLEAAGLVQGFNEIVWELPADRR